MLTTRLRFIEPTLWHGEAAILPQFNTGFRQCIHHGGWVVPRPRSGLNARIPSLHAGTAFCDRRLPPMAKIILLVALAFSITTGSITMLVLNPQPAMACPGNNGR